MPEIIFMKTTETGLETTAKYDLDEKKKVADFLNDLEDMKMFDGSKKTDQQPA